MTGWRGLGTTEGIAHGGPVKKKSTTPKDRARHQAPLEDFEGSSTRGCFIGWACSKGIVWFQTKCFSLTGLRWTTTRTKLGKLVVDCECTFLVGEISSGFCFALRRRPGQEDLAENVEGHGVHRTICDNPELRESPPDAEQ